MSEQVYAGRYTAETDEPFVVFLIGSRVNSLRKFWKARWISGAMTTMMQTLYARPETGFLGGESFFRIWPFSTIMVSYWRSYDDLERFAHNKTDPHLEPWRRFNREIGSDGSFGIWHETYVVNPGQFEVIYGNMPQFGLAKAVRHVPIHKRTDSASQRLNQHQPIDDGHRYTKSYGATNTGR